MNFKGRVMSFFLFSLVILLSSCATTLTRVNVSAPKDFELRNMPVDKKIPLRAALYVDPKIKTYEYVGQPIFEPGKVFLGDAITSACERTLKNVFDEVIILDSVSNEAWSGRVDVLIRAETIKMVLLNKPKKNGAFFYNVFQTSMKWNILNPQNSKLYTNVIVSEEEQKPVSCFPITTSCLEEGMRNYLLAPLREQFQKTQDEIYSSGWWKEYVAEAKETKK
ncbi:MAG: hypothetical protein HZC48_09970 [Nitrospirae bacterium]|nr:hypothetical protein [Nitrospirota bacterium]